MRAQTALMLGACLTAGVCAGAVAGLDAARNVDAVYTAPRPVRYAAQMPASSPWDWNETPIAASPPPGLPAQAEPAERAFFDIDPTFRAAEPVEHAVVRVHRSRRAPEPVVIAPAAPAEESLPEPVLVESEPAPTT